MDGLDVNHGKEPVILTIIMSCFIVFVAYKPMTPEISYVALDLGSQVAPNSVILSFKCAIELTYPPQLHTKATKVSLSSLCHLQPHEKLLHTSSINHFNYL